jgi:hypothetical protein
MKKCPPGVICIENVSLFFVVLCVAILGYIIYTFRARDTTQSTRNENVFFSRERDPLSSPYNPPLRNEQYGMMKGVVPINVSTNVGAVDTEYRQVGILTALNTKGKIIALMGRPLFTNRDKWQYYTISNQNNAIKLPISRNGKSCTSEYGCDRLTNGDSVYIEGINEAYKVTLYDNDTMRYLPFV